MRRAATLALGICLGLALGILILFEVNRLRTSPGDGPISGETESLAGLEVDSPAPDFELAALSGERIRLEALRGQVVLINFWATWCQPCRTEMPAFQARAEKYPDTLAVLAVNAQDTPEAMQAFMDELGLTFDALIDEDGAVHRQYLVTGFPSSFLIDKDGILRVRQIGVMTEDQLDGYLAGLGLDN